MNNPTVIITEGMENGRPYTLTRGSKCWVKSFNPPGSEPTDETCTHPLFGQINVSLIMRAINRREIEPQCVEFPIDESWQRVTREADINPARLAQITDDECSPGNPLILIRTKTGDPTLSMAHTGCATWSITAGLLPSAFCSLSSRLSDFAWSC